MLTAYSGILGVIIGSIVFGYIKPYGSLIDLIIGIAFIVVTLRMLYEGITGLIAAAPPQPAPASGQGLPGTPLSKSILGSAIGFLTGIIGLGGGYAWYLLSSTCLKRPCGSLSELLWLPLYGWLWWELFSSCTSTW
nr:hypothetical protein [Syntrophothermus sp.]